MRYLQTLNSISAENNSTIIFPVPIDIVSNFMQFSNNNHQQEQYQLYVQSLTVDEQKFPPPPPCAAPKPPQATDDSKECNYEYLLNKNMGFQAWYLR